MGTASEQIAYLSRSANRPRLLRSIADQPGTPSDLVERCSISRATVQRIIADFENYGWVIKNNGKYGLTAAGSLILETYEETITKIDQIIETKPVLRQFSSGNEPPVRPLSQSDIVVASDDQPHAPVFHYRKQLTCRTIEAQYIVDPIANPTFDEIHHDLYEECQSVTVILNSNFETSIENSGWLVDVSPEELYVYPGKLSVGLVISEDDVLAIFYDEDWSVKVCVDSTNKNVVRWFTLYVMEKKADAKRLSK
ncbi:helix-turn-helix transcriptional regulator [Natrinema pallidum]|uniref:helix-turn-helix transcriptional regulator n=1 Tax=Natrinema pallidum TaxID=69527 RepID=UPI0009FEB2A3